MWRGWDQARWRIKGGVAAAAMVAAGVAGLVPTPGGVSAGPASAAPAAARAAVAATGFGSNWTVYHQNAAGSGVDPANTDLSSVTPAWTSPTLDGQIYGEPLVEDGRVIVATENNTVYALAANSGGILWQTHIATAASAAELPCGDIGPTVGITSTPVIDPGRNEVFVVADEQVGAKGASHHLVGLSLTTGTKMLDTPADPPGSIPVNQLQRPGLTLDAGRVIIGFGGNDGDCAFYHGWLAAVPESGGPMLTFEVSAPSGDSEGAIWMGGAAPLIDGAGHIWVATGNGAFSSMTSPYDYSDGVLELSANLQPTNRPLAFFAPSTWQSDNGADLDLGSSAPALLSDDLLFQAGKSQSAYLTSQSSPGGVGGQLALSPNFCGNDVDGGNAVLGLVVYSPCLNGVVRTQVQVTPGHPPALSAGSPSATGSGGPPIVAGGAVWTIDAGGGNLYGLNPDNLDVVLQGPFSLGGSIGNHFPTPTVADGLVLAPGDSAVYAFVGPAGLPPPPPSGPSFVLRPGEANDVGVGANGSVWVVGINPVPGGFGIWHWTGTAWGPVPGGAVAIAVDPQGNPWAVNSLHQIFHWTGTGWALFPGEANDVGVGANGSVWVVGINPVPGGFGIWHSAGRGWAPVAGGAVRISVDPDGNPWVVNSLHQIFRWNGRGWPMLPGSANDVGVGANGAAWVTGTDPVGGGFGIFAWTGRAWAQASGGAVRVAVDPRGNPWVVNSLHQIYSS